MTTLHPRRLLLVIALLVVSGCSGGALSTREKDAGIGAVGGAGAGALIGSAVERPSAGAAIGGVLGLGAGALVGDQLQVKKMLTSSNSNKFKPTRLKSTVNGESCSG
jgi:osmotically inducible lipoprotein OsmB